MWKPWIVLLVVLAGCAEAPDATAPDALPRLSVEPLFGTLYSNIREPARLVISDAETWAAVWAGMIGPAGSPADAPAVDFSRENVLIAAMGERRGGGYAIAITGLARAGGRIEAEIQSTIPAGCSGADVMTTPLDAVRIPKTAELIQFAEKSRILRCTES